MENYKVELPTTNEERIDVLDVFLESAADLSHSWFVKHAIDNGINSVVELLPDGSVDAVVDGPHRDALKAVLLTLRFFNRSNYELSSIRNVATIISEPELRVRQELISEYENTRKDLNDYLDSSPEVLLPELGDKTKRDIFDTFLYGRFAHSNPRKRKIALQWEKSNDYQHIEIMFLKIVMHYIERTSLLGETVKKILDEHVE